MGTFILILLCFTFCDQICSQTLPDPVKSRKARNDQFSQCWEMADIAKILVETNRYDSAMYYAQIAWD